MADDTKVEEMSVDQFEDKLGGGMYGQAWGKTVDFIVELLNESKSRKAITDEAKASIEDAQTKVDDFKNTLDNPPEIPGASEEIVEAMLQGLRTQMAQQQEIVDAGLKRIVKEKLMAGPWESVAKPTTRSGNGEKTVDKWGSYDRKTSPYLGSRNKRRDYWERLGHSEWRENHEPVIVHGSLLEDSQWKALGATSETPSREVHIVARDSEGNVVGYAESLGEIGSSTKAVEKIYESMNQKQASGLGNHMTEWDQAKGPHPESSDIGIALQLSELAAQESK